MKSLTCRDIGSQGCDYRAEGETAEAVKADMYKHAHEAHPDTMANMSEEDMRAADKKMDELLVAQM